MLTVLCLCGLPASGKSTLSSRLSSVCREGSSFSSVSTISFDDIEQSISSSDGSTSSNTVEAWKAARPLALGQLTSLVTDFSVHYAGSPSTARARGLIIVDDNFHYRSMRREIYSTLLSIVSSSSSPASANSSSFSVTLGFATLTVPLEVSVSTDSDRGSRSVGEEVIRKMAQRFEPVDPTKFPSCEKNSISLNGHDDVQGNVARLLEVIETSWAQPERAVVKVENVSDRVERIEADRIVSRTNRVARVDGVLRRLVGEVCRGGGGGGASRANSANRARKLVLEEVRSEKEGGGGKGEEKLWDEGECEERFRAVLESLPTVEPPC
ncbi:hypothetical protein ScalyP_jg1901 [Parmales sp. scaly parma]|nr:hypothetical protein ScalyP_jg1901 [Parmales sp. scaly parma]